MNRRKRTLAIVAVLLLLLLGLPSIIVWREYRRHRLDHDLIAEVKRVDAKAVTTLLEEGADANARETSQPDINLSAMFRRLIRQWRRQPDESEPVSGSAALDLILMAATPTHHPHGDLSAHDIIAAALIKHGAHMNGLIMGPPLDFAAYYCMHLTARAAIERGANVNHVHDYSATPLMHTDAEITALLLQQGADPKLRDDDGWTPLMYACHDDGANVERVRLLLNAGSDPNARDKRGATPLMFASTREVAEILLQHGADANARDDEGTTVSFRAHLVRAFDAKHEPQNIKQDEALHNTLKAYGAKE